SIAADKDSAARLRRFACCRYHLRGARVICANAAARAISVSERVPSGLSGLRSSLGRKDSDARQSRIERDSLFTENARWITRTNATELHAHPATLVPGPTARPPLDYPGVNVVAFPYEMQWFTQTSGHTGQANLFGDQKFWRTKFLDAYKKHIAFKTLDAFVGNPSANFQRILKHPTADSYYDAMVPTREQFQKITLPILTITGQYDGDELEGTDLLSRSSR